MAPLQVPQRLANGMGLPGAEMVSSMMRLWSPTQINPFNLNPLRELLERIVDVDALRTSSIRLHVAATNVETGAARLFSGDDLSIDALMASACLPFLYQPVTIDGVAYWDGGYSANPPVEPLCGEAAEILLVQINPDCRLRVPSSATDILDRVNEITFNASLLAELRLFELDRACRERDGMHPDDLPRLHRIALHDALGDAVLSGKGSLDANDHRALRERGRLAADRWLAGG